ncbi:MAG TPA: hypothetical protein VGX48_14750 [Pyrinomonadaceae bacterium]|jgi:hypothetical protein|nr:hypothetical protein [Pyrinomonadaceae bacterium]
MTKALLVVMMVLSAGASASAQGRDPFEGRRRAEARSNPPGVRLVVRLKGGQTRFRPGELIGLELAFSSDAPGAYRLDNAGHDRGGRLDIDDFHLDPEDDGAADPLGDYFDAGLFGFMGGGARSYPELEAKPHVVNVELNEWVRVERPGRYRLYVTSHRVAPLRRREGDEETTPVTSNVVEFEILPADPAWSKRALAEAAKVLDSKDAAADHRAACRVMRFLNTEAATRELVRRLRVEDSPSGCEHEFNFGLLGTPHRALAVSEMERRLVAPDHPVTTEFLRTLAFLSLLRQQGFAPLPEYVPGDEARTELLTKEYERRRAAYKTALDGYMRRLTLAVFAKEGRARALSIDALLWMRASPPRREGDAGQEDEKLLKEALAAVFTELPVGEQSQLLEYQWELVASPAMLPALRRIYQSPPKGDDRLPGFALRRIHELAPDEGRRLILEELRRAGGPKVPAQALAVLKDETLPEADALVASALGASGGVEEELMLRVAERYATSASAPPLLSHYEGRVGRMPCAPQAALLAYFMRVEPATGAALVEKALASRKDSGCYRALLTDVAALFPSAELERKAVESLDDADPEVVYDAAQMLCWYGSASARDVLLRRFERWREEWAGREKELAAQDERGPSASQSRVEWSLLHALAYSPAWLADAEMLERLRRLCVTKACLEAADSALGQFAPSVTVYLNGADGGLSSASLAQYRLNSWEGLKEKAAQFPKGTTFKWSSDAPDTDRDKRAFAELGAHLEKLGMKLTR